MKNLVAGWFLAVSLISEFVLIQNYSSGDPIPWGKMRDVYRQIPEFLGAYEEELEEKVLKISPSR